MAAPGATSSTPTRSALDAPSGVRCALWHWEPPTAAVGLVVLFHGMGSHARFPSTSLAAEVLSAGGFAVCSPDMPGHGESDGLRGFLLSSEALEEDGEAQGSAALAIALMARAAIVPVKCPRRRETPQFKF